MTLTPINSISPHPQNPRVGNVEAIAESLGKFGQYKPIVVRRATSTILAGSHTWQAAKGLGWRSIDVVWADVSDDDALAIMVADNRIGDLGSANAVVLAETLASVNSFTGTGYSPSDARKLLADLAEPAEIDISTPLPDLAPTPKVVAGDDMDERAAPNVIVAHHRFRASEDALETWVGELGRDPNVAIIKRLGFASSRIATDLPVERVATGSLEMHPANAREGDIGALCASLERFGQYKPIVCSRATRRVLAGNHTWQACQMLARQMVDVIWVDVDEDEEVAIMLADNRTAELGGYDPDLLRDVLAGMSGNLHSTGYDGDDLDAILAHRFLAPAARRRRTSTGLCQIGSVKVRLLGHHFARLVADCDASKDGARQHLQNVLQLPQLRKV